MAVRRDSRGKWRYRKVIELPDGSAKRISGTPSLNTKRAAEDAERAHIQRALHPSAQQKQKERRTLHEFAEDFMATYVQANNKPSEQAGKRTVLKKHLYPVLGDRPLDQIGQKDIEKLKADLLGVGKSPKTVNNVLAVLRKILRYAVEVEELEHAPHIKKVKVPPQDRDFLDEDEFQALVGAAEGDLLVAVLLAGHAGLRRGELLALQRRDVDYRARVLNVRRSSWNGQVGAPKSHKARTVPMTEQLRAALVDSRHMRGPTVLADRDGKPWTVETLRWHLPKLCDLAGLRPIGWHALRHTFCSHLAMKGAPARAIQELAGHADLSTTLRYMHLAPSVLEDAVALLDRPSEWQQRGKTKKAP